MNWGTAAEFFEMGGHGLFVWGSYGVCLLIMAVEPLMAVRRRRMAMNTARQVGYSAPGHHEEDE